MLIEYARRETSVADLAELAAPFLERLRRDTGETANIAIPLPGGVTRLAELESAHPLGAGNWPGVRIPLHASAMGKVFMAFGAAQPPTGRLARLAPNTITTVPDILLELERVRESGYATTWEELEEGLCSVAAPVRGSRGTRDRRDVRVGADRAGHARRARGAGAAAHARRGRALGAPRLRRPGARAVRARASGSA